jgi:hypothetical protein
MSTKSTKFKVKGGNYGRTTVYRGDTPIIYTSADEDVAGVCSSIMLVGISPYKSTYKKTTLYAAMKALLRHFNGYGLVMAVVRSDKNKAKLFDPKLWSISEGYPGNYYNSQGMYTLDVYTTNPTYLKREGKI